MKTQNNRYKEIYTNTNFKTWFCKSVEEQVMSAHNGTYKTASSKWAGGDTFYIINFTDEETEVSASGVTETVWSKNGKWSGNNLNVDICAHKSVIQLDMLTTAGVLNLFIERIGNKKYRAKWVEQARGYNLKVVEGYILHGIHIKGSLKSAEAKINKIRRDRYFKAKSIKVLKNLDNVSVLSRIWVSTSDSLKSGNCKVGTTNFIRAAQFEKYGAVRADVLIQEAQKHGVLSYAKRAIIEAQSRYFVQ